MTYLFALSKEHIALARAEALSLCDPKSECLVGNLLLLDIAKSEAEFLSKRLAYTRSIHEVLFSCREKGLSGKLRSFPWKKQAKGSFAVRVEQHRGKQPTAASLGNVIGSALNSARVDLKNPENTITFFFTEKEVYVCVKRSENTEDFNARKAHRRAANHPTAMHPKLARALVNLSGCRKGMITDPFCGAGGILIEAGLMGLKMKGSDIDEKMIARCEKNLQQFRMEADLSVRDARALSFKNAYVVTDLPYGKSSKMQEGLYKDFLRALKGMRRSVLVFPMKPSEEFLDGFSAIHSFSIYVHRSLTRHIVLIE